MNAMVKARRQHMGSNATYQGASTNPPCLRLKALRERAGLTAKKVAEYLSQEPHKVFPKGSQTTWYRYESPDRMGDNLIPWHIAEAIIPLFVGKGKPPIQVQEIVDISEARKLANASPASLVSTRATALELPTSIVSPVFRSDDSTISMLQVRFRSERGVFMDDAVLRSRSFGIAPLAKADDVRGEQFAVLVADDHAAPVYPRGTVLQVVAAKDMALHDMLGRRVVMRVPNEALGLSEVAVAVVESVVGNTAVTRTLDGTHVEGVIEAVVFGKYQREF